MLRKIIVILLFCSCSNVLIAETRLLRQESSFLSDADFQLNSTWWLWDAEFGNSLRLSGEVTGFWETSSGEFQSLIVGAGPVFSLGTLTIKTVAGVRLRPEKDLDASHAIGKVNVFGKRGPYAFSFINDFSAGVGRASNQHFFHYQLTRQPDSLRLGWGVRSDLLLSGSEETAWTAGPVFPITLRALENDQRHWVFRLEVYPFYRFTDGDIGVKFNFLNLRFGR